MHRSYPDLIAIQVIILHYLDEIKGVVVNNEEIKLTLFTDDMTCFLRDIASYNRLMAMFQLFSKFSNLQVNNDKTEIFAIGR